MTKENEEDRDHPIKLLKVMTGILIGFLVGAAAMLFLAPKSGKDTRMDIQNKSIELRDQSTEKTEDAMAQIRSKMNQFAQESRGVMNDFRSNNQEIVLEQFGPSPEV